MSVLHRVGIYIVVLLSAALVGYVYIGADMVAAHPKQFAPPQLDFVLQDVRFDSANGNELSGWFVAGEQSIGVVVLLHDHAGDRRDMLGRAAFLHAAGYAVLLFDFQAHGNSAGEQFGFGVLETGDVIGAVAYVKNREPNMPVYVHGVTLGATAAMLADPPLAIDGLIVESAYPTVEQAVGARLRMRFGDNGAALTSMFVRQLNWRLGFDLAANSPLEKAASISAPVFVIGAGEDLRINSAQTLAFYQAFGPRKSIWLVGGATVQDLHSYATAQYESRVLEFLAHAAGGNRE